MSVTHDNAPISRVEFTIWVNFAYDNYISDSIMIWDDDVVGIELVKLPNVQR